MEKDKLKILFLAPHLSTGGMPQFLLKRVEALINYTKCEVFVIEWCNYSYSFTVQKNQLKELLGDNLFNFGSLDEPDKGEHGSRKDLIKFLYDKKIDIVHIEEIPEGFDSFSKFDTNIQKDLYDKKHPWRIVETCHNITFNPEKSKIFEPDGYACVTPHHVKNTFKNRPAQKSLISYPIDLSIQHVDTREKILNDMGYRLNGEYHIINVGLWTPGKNQKYAIEIARELYNKYGFTYIFHFIGNQASNFSNYWEPLMEDLPPNIRIWGERNDVDKFFKFSDLMLFTSNFECNPIVLKEAISNNKKILAYNLSHYGNEYNSYINNLSGELDKDINLLIDTIHSSLKYDLVSSNSISKFALEHLDFYNNLLENETKR